MYDFRNMKEIIEMRRLQQEKQESSQVKATEMYMFLSCSSFFTLCSWCVLRCPYDFPGVSSAFYFIRGFMQGKGLPKYPRQKIPNLQPFPCRVFVLSSFADRSDSHSLLWHRTQGEVPWLRGAVVGFHVGPTWSCRGAVSAGCPRGSAGFVAAWNSQLRGGFRGGP